MLILFFDPSTILASCSTDASQKGYGTCRGGTPDAREAHAVFLTFEAQLLVDVSNSELHLHEHALPSMALTLT